MAEKLDYNFRPDPKRTDSILELQELRTKEWEMIRAGETAFELKKNREKIEALERKLGIRGENQLDLSERHDTAFDND